MKATFRPLRWSGPTTPAHQRRSRWTFKAAWSDTLDLLDRELVYLDARNVVIEADFREQDIRLDGMPRSNARQPVHPGVRIAFESKHGPLVYATDSCENWQHNVRSIALGLEALRAVDRYGVTKRGEQYTGWKAIEAGYGAVTTVEEARQLLDSYGGEAAALKATHPDYGGDRAAFDGVQAARRLLAAAGGAR